MTDLRTRVLLDAHTLIWAISNPERLSPLAARIITDPPTQCLVSVATLWELAIKQSIGKLQLAQPVISLFESSKDQLNASMLPITAAHISTVATLPFHHKDPFDRMIVAQSMVESVPLVSADSALDMYGLDRLW